MGGAERVAEAMHDSFPSAPIYTTVALPHSLSKRLRAADIRTSAMQRLPAMDRRFRHYFMLYPFAVEHFDLSAYDLIFSSSSGYANDVNRFHMSNETDDYYLVLSRLMPYKRIDLAIEACKRMNRRLIIVGDGPDRARLEKIADDRIEFLGRQPDAIVNYYAARCRALLFPGEEDFGMAPLEANAAGRPVIAYRGGGAMETVAEGKTGVFFDQPDSRTLANAIEEFESLKWDQYTLRWHAEKFDRTVFAFRVLQFLGSVAPASCAEELL